MTTESGIDVTQIILALDSIQEQQTVTNGFLAVMVGFLFAYAFLAFVFMRK